MQVSTSAVPTARILHFVSVERRSVAAARVKARTNAALGAAVLIPALQLRDFIAMVVSIESTAMSAQSATIVAAEALWHSARRAISVLVNVQRQRFVYVPRAMFALQAQVHRLHVPLVHTALTTPYCCHVRTQETFVRLARPNPCLAQQVTFAQMQLLP